MENKNKKVYIRKGLNQNNGHTIKGGIFTTIANQYPSQYKYHARNISVRRSNVIIDGITHYVKGELDHGAPYSSFISTKDAADIIIRNCLLTGHKKDNTIGAAKKPVSMGSYDLGFGTTVNLRMENITLKNCTFGHMGVRMVGCGTIYMENCTINTNYLLSLRADYGSSWEGDIVIKNCSLNPQNKNIDDIVFLSGTNNGDHDFGYECMLPSVIDINGLVVNDEAIDNPNYKGPHIFATFGRDVKKSGLQPYKATEKVILKNVTVKSGKEISVSANTEMFKNVEVIYTVSVSM